MLEKRRRISREKLKSIIERVLTKEPDVRLINPLHFWGPQTDYLPDLMFEHDQVIHSVVVLGEAPRTETRFHGALDYLVEMEHSLRELRPGISSKLVIAMPDEVTHHLLDALRGIRVDIWDVDWLRFQVSGRDTDLDAEEVFPLSPGQLRAELEKLPGGRESWVAYQRLCGKILTTAFCPPLEDPIVELSNAGKANRRDFILPNYSDSGFWEFMRSQYRADFVVADAKNYRDPIPKDCILQVGNYLSLAGLGLFGMLLTRKGMDGSAEQVRRDLWVNDRKLIVVFDDEDILLLLEMCATNADPSDLVRQKIEDFRLSL
ncbi:hypothetical protein AB0F83_26225 [Micromonospora chalcea]|uniref:hypothetical protein n=1 Tax=Micromonospora chalcea TaxID=1874 RepID=UPI0033C412C5